MGSFPKSFQKEDATANIVTDHMSFEPPECQSLRDIKEYMDTLLSQNRYIAKSEYRAKLLDAKNTVARLLVLQSYQVLDDFCRKNGLSLSDVESALSEYKNFETRIDEHNESFIRQAMTDKQLQRYFDDIFKKIDPQIKLDEDQRRVILTDEDRCLVIAGAGAGKTTTIAAKVKYLVDEKKEDPSQILVISFTRAAVKELQKRLNTDLKINCPITTFHSIGNDILNEQSPEMHNVVESSELYFVLQDYFKNSILKDESLVKSLILFFASYFDAPYEEGEDLNSYFQKIAKSNLATMRSNLNEFNQKVINIRTKNSVTIQRETVKSHQELEIANFLYLNGIDYEYEPKYPYPLPNSKKVYTPDFIIRQGDKVAYIEHFGITEDGENDRFSARELKTYINAKNDKIKHHKKHRTKLIYTYSRYNDCRPLLDHLKENLENNGFELHPRSNEEVMDKLIATEENPYIKKLVNLICRFITNFKTNGSTADEFDRLYLSAQNVRTQLFLKICSACYLEYERYLKEKNAVDFADMINKSARLLQEYKEKKKKLGYKYIIVDEYQDISRQRFNFVKALSEVTDAKIMAVGDDWQSIYAFSGSDITLFTEFEKEMGYAKLLKITNTYRNSQEVIDIAGHFIQKNETQITKELKSPKRIDKPVIIYTYKADSKSGANDAIAQAVEAALEHIIKFKGKSKKSSVLLLGRFGFDRVKLEKSGLFEYNKLDRTLKSKNKKYKDLDITFMTVHASKGLGYDNVIVINGRNETYGFPSKIEDDPVLKLVIKGDSSIDYAEERRLFYVAMTRTKNRVYFIAPEQNPSEFLLEIKRDYKNVVLHGKWNEEPPQNDIATKTCPICGYPMQYRYKNALLGLPLYICTNEPELCGFMTNEYDAGNLPILKCSCRGGYLIVKKGTGDYFLGCTNYKKDGTGCDKRIARLVYEDNFTFAKEFSAITRKKLKL